VGCRVGLDRRDPYSPQWVWGALGVVVLLAVLCLLVWLMGEVVFEVFRGGGFFWFWGAAFGGFSRLFGFCRLSVLLGGLRENLSRKCECIVCVLYSEVGWSLRMRG